MNPPRTPLGQLSLQHVFNKPLTQFQRGAIVGAKLLGSTCLQISKQLELPLSTVKYTVRVDHLRTAGNTRTKKPRGKSYSVREGRNIVWHVRKFLKDTYVQVKHSLNLTCSYRTISCVLRESGITNWVCKQRPKLTEIHTTKRLAWCILHKDWNTEE